MLGAGRPSLENHVSNRKSRSLSLCTAIAVLSLNHVAFAEQPKVAPAAAAGGSTPCSSSAHREFDFWLGEWDVTNPEGSPAGKSFVTLELRGCVVHEHWEGAGSGVGFDGQSFNLYEESSKTWRQSWVDNMGQGLALLQGGYAGGKMVLLGEKETPRGRRWVRVTWSSPAPDQVRQTVEASADGGKTWTMNFDGRYRRRPK